jgi:hypothetical protein
MNNLFKYISLEDLQNGDSPLVYFITEEMVQDFAEANYDRRLTEKEVAELFYGFCEDDQNLCSFMDGAVEFAIGEDQVHELRKKSHKPEEPRTEETRVPANCPSEFPLLYVIQDVVQTYAMVAFGRQLTREEMEAVATNIALEASQKLHEQIERQVRITDLEAAKK